MSSPGKGGKGKKGSVTASVATGLPNPEQMVTGGTAEPAKAGLTVKPVAVTQEECESAADAVMPLEGGGGTRPLVVRVRFQKHHWRSWSPMRAKRL